MDGSFHSHELEGDGGRANQPCLLSRNVQGILGMVKDMRSGKVTLDGGQEINSYVCASSGLTCICISDFATKDGKIVFSEEVDGLRINASIHLPDVSPDVERKALMAKKGKKKKRGDREVSLSSSDVSPPRQPKQSFDVTSSKSGDSDEDSWFGSPKTSVQAKGSRNTPDQAKDSTPTTDPAEDSPKVPDQEESLSLIHI